MSENELENLAKVLDEKEIPALVEALGSSKDEIRYPAFLLLRSLCRVRADLYPYWDTFADRLGSDNSYQRTIGLVMLAGNAQWDIHNKMDGVIERYLSLLDDEKAPTVRQCIQSIADILPCKKHLHGMIADKLMSVNISERKETQRRLVLKDILGILLQMQRLGQDERISIYIEETRKNLDKKTEKELFG